MTTGITSNGTASEPPSPPPARQWVKGPPGHWLFGNVFEFGRDPLRFLEQCVRDGGDFVSIRFANKPVMLLNDTTAMEEVLAGQAKHFVKGQGFLPSLVGRIFGQGLLMSDGATWTRQRRLAQPAFHRGRISGYADMIVDYSAKLAATWRSGERRAVHAELTELTTRIVSKAFFNLAPPQEIVALEHAAIPIMETADAPKHTWALLASFLPGARKKQLTGVLDRLDEFFYRLIKERRANPEDQGDVLSMLLQTRDEQGEGMNDRQLRDELATLMAAGLDTTVLAMSWTCYLLALHPDAGRKLTEEVRTVLQGRPPTLADLGCLKYTEAVIKEGMRLYPPAWMTVREAVVDCTIAGHAIPKGTPVMLSQWLKHRDARIFERPNEFRPERWLEQQNLPRMGYFPFGGGQRVCIGSGFAMMEAPLALATISQKFRFECDPAYVVEPWASLTLQPRGGIELVVQAV